MPQHASRETRQGLDQSNDFGIICQQRSQKQLSSSSTAIIGLISAQNDVQRIRKVPLPS